MIHIMFSYTPAQLFLSLFMLDALVLALYNFEC